MKTQLGARALVILSGGIDSTTALALMLKREDTSWPAENVLAISFSYGQRHKKELECAAAIARHYGVEHHVIDLTDAFEFIGGSVLTSSEGTIPTDGYKGGIPATFVPGRNIVFLSVAGGIARARGINYIVGGWTTVDYSGYPDCREDFLKNMQKALRHGLAMPDLYVVAPLLHRTKSAIVKIGLSLGVPYEKTWSCYQGGDLACGVCDSCRFRLAAFMQAGVQDPIGYVKRRGTKEDGS